MKCSNNEDLKELILNNGVKPLESLNYINETPNLNQKFNNDEPVNCRLNGQIEEIKGFTLLSSLDKDIVIDLKYATADNFTKKVIYPNNVCVLRENTAKKLVRANAQLKELGYRIKVWDAYRPIYIQQIFWDIVKDIRFAANPKNGGSIHNKGCAVDVTLVNNDGNELNMPSKFDDFSANACRTNSTRTSEAEKNMNLLTRYMVDSGFATIDSEWWHFDDVDSKKYEIADINLKLFSD
jgi:D-alanyl-D-alanine dipeptidase